MEKDLSNLPKFINTNLLCMMEDKTPGLMEKGVYLYLLDPY